MMYTSCPHVSLKDRPDITQKIQGYCFTANNLLDTFVRHLIWAIPGPEEYMRVWWCVFEWTTRFCLFLFVLPHGKIMMQYSVILEHYFGNTSLTLDPRIIRHWWNFILNWATHNQLYSKVVQITKTLTFHNVSLKGYYKYSKQALNWKMTQCGYRGKKHSEICTQA